MGLLLLYLFIALGVSFLCSLLESTLMSTSLSYINLRVEEGYAPAKLMQQYKENTGKPLAAMAFLETVWGRRDKPYIAVRPLNHADEEPHKGSWQFTNAIDSYSWRPYEGKNCIAEVYSEGSDRMQTARS